MGSANSILPASGFSVFEYTHRTHDNIEISLIKCLQPYRLNRCQLVYGKEDPGPLHLAHGVTGINAEAS